MRTFPSNPVEIGSFRYPLTAFYHHQGLPEPLLEQIDQELIPEPQQSLLVHDKDMTPTLESYHRDRIYISALHSHRSDSLYYREVVLYLDRDDRSVELGAICVDMTQLPEAAAEILLEERRPFGTILADFQIPHLSRPQAFLRMRPDSLTDHAFGAQPVEWLYGRRNRLLTPQGESLAEIVEILPFT